MDSGAVRGVGAVLAGVGWGVVGGRDEFPWVLLVGAGRGVVRGREEVAWVLLVAFVRRGGMVDDMLDLGVGFDILCLD